MKLLLGFTLSLISFVLLAQNQKRVVPSVLTYEMGNTQSGVDEALIGAFEEIEQDSILIFSFYPNSDSSLQSKTIFNHDSEGDLVEQLHWSGGRTVLKRVLEYDDQKRLVLETYLYLNGDNWRGTYSEFEYDGGTPISQAFYELVDNQKVYSYKESYLFEDNRLVSNTYQSWNSESEDWDPSTRIYLYSYNDNGKVVAETWKYRESEANDWVVDRTYEYGYDVQGNVIKVVNYVLSEGVLIPEWLHTWNYDEEAVHRMDSSFIWLENRWDLRSHQEVTLDENQNAVEGVSTEFSIQNAGGSTTGEAKVLRKFKSQYDYKNRPLNQVSWIWSESSQTWNLDSRWISYYPGNAPLNNLSIRSTSIYPNPSYDGIFHIQGENLNDSPYKVYNLAGEEVAKGNGVNGTISLNSLVNGTYFLFMNEGNLNSHRLIIRK